MQPTAPVTAGDLVFVAGEDGTVRAYHSASGKPAWTAHTGGTINYPPSIDNGRVYVGSGDGWIYCLAATSGQTLWRFRAAPVERKLPVYGKLLSTWPVASGVMVADGVANLHYLDGTDLLGGDGEAATDGSHPNDMGMVRYANAYEPILRNLLASND